MVPFDDEIQKAKARTPLPQRPAPAPGQPPEDVLPAGDDQLRRQQLMDDAVARLRQSGRIAVR